MSYRYRGIFAALAGLALLGANHADAKGGSEQPEAHQSIEASLQNISARTDDAAKRAESANKEDQPCGPEQYGSHADLCAQWKAADAAADSAWWAWAGGIIGLGSLIGVFAAIGLAFHSNWIARDTAKRQLRAYVVFDGFKENAPHLGQGGGHHFAAMLRNVGQTPARRLRHKFNCQLMPEGVPQDFAYPDHAPDTEPEPIVLGAGRHIEGAGPIITQAMYDHLEASGSIFLIWGWIEYEDVFGSNWRTEYSVKLTILADNTRRVLSWDQGSRFNNMDEDCLRWTGRRLR